MSQSITFFIFFQFQKLDADLIFEDGITNSLNDDKSSNHFVESSRTKVVSKRSLSDSDKQKVEVSQSQSDEGWWSRVKRSIKNFFWKEEEKVVEKREIVAETNKSQEKLVDITSDPNAARKKRQYDDDEDDFEDNEIGSGDEVITPETTATPDPVTQLPPVKDDKFCK